MSIFFGSPTFPTEKEQREARQYDAKGILELAGLAARSEHSIEFFAEARERSLIPGERDFIPSVDLLLEMTEPLPDGTLWPEGEYSDYAGAQSETEMRLMRAQRANRLQMRQELARHGWKGVALQFGAAMLDPVDVGVGVAAGFAAGPLGLTAHYGKKATTLTRMANSGYIAKQGAKAAGLGVASVLPNAVYLATQDPEQDETDVMLAMIIGGAFGLGGDALGQYLRRGRLQKDAEFVQIARAHLDADTPGFAMGAAGSAEGGSLNDSMREILTPEGRDYFKEQLGVPERPSPSNDTLAKIPESGRVYHGTAGVFDGDAIDPSRSGGLVSFAAEPHVAGNYATGAGGNRLYTNDRGLVRDTYDGIIYEPDNPDAPSVYSPIGILGDDGVTIDPNIPDNIGASDLKASEVAAGSQYEDQLFAGFPDNPRLIERDISGLSILDLQSEAGLRVLASLDASGNARAQQIIEEAAGAHPNTRGTGGSFRWDNTKLTKQTGAMDPIIEQLDQLGYDGIAFLEDGGTTTYATFRDPARQPSGPTAEELNHQFVDEAIKASTLDEIEDAEIIAEVRKLGEQGIIDRYSDFVDPARRESPNQKIEPRDEIDSVLLRAFANFERENAEKIREVAMPAPQRDPGVVTDAAETITPDAARRQLADAAQAQDPDALVVVGHDVDGYWIYGKDAAPDVADFLGNTVEDIDGVPAVKIAPEAWASARRQLDEGYERLRILRTKTAENGKTYTHKPPPETKPYVKKAIPDRLAERLGFAFTGVNEIGRRVPAFMTPERADRLNIELDRLAPSLSPEDQFDLMLARFYLIDNAGELNTSASGPTQAVNASDVQVGDSWRIGQDDVEVLAIDADTVTIRQTEFRDSLVEGLDEPPLEREFTVPKDAALPFNERQGIDRPLNVEVAGVDLSDRPATPEMVGGDPPDIPEDKPGAFSLPNLHSTKATLDKARFSLAVGPGRSTIPETRMAGVAMMKDLLLRYDKDGRPIPSVYSASQERRRAVTAMTVPWQIEHDKAYKSWAKRHGKAAWRQKNLDEFDELAGQSKRAGGSSDPDVQRAIDATTKAYDEVVEYAQLNNTKGFEDIENRPDYLARIWNERNIYALANKHDWETVDQVIAGSYRKANPDADEDLAMKVGTGMRKTILDNRLHNRIQRAALFAGDVDESLQVVLNDLDIDADAKEAILGVFARPDSGTRGVNERARRRVLLDETAIVDTKNGPIPLTALIDNNIQTTTHNYISSVVGSAVSQKVYRALTPPERIEQGRGVFETWSQVQSMIEDRIARIDDVDIKNAEYERLEDLELVDRHIRGLPLRKDTKSSRFARRLLGINYVRQSGGFGLAQAAEFGHFAENPAAFAAHFPSAMRIMRRLQSGEISSDMMAELEHATGVGADGIMQRMTTRHHDLADENRNLQRGFDIGLQRMGLAASRLSGFEYIDSMLKRLSVMTTGESIYRQAISGRKPRPRRLAALGLNDEQWDRVTKAIKDARDSGAIRTEKGPTGKRVAEFGLDDWADQDAAQLFVRAIQTNSERVIQVNDIGAMPKWLLTSDWARVLAQFRTFALVSYENQLLSRFQMRDRAAIVGGVLSGVIGGLIWGARMYGVSLTKDDPQAWRDEFLTPEKLLLAGFQRSSTSTFLPEVYDTLAPLAGFDPAFNARYTGISNQLSALDLSQSPTGQTASSLVRAVSGVGSALTGQDPFTEKDMRAITNLMPFQNQPIIRAMLDLMLQAAPEDE